MAKKYERRRRALKELQSKGENANALLTAAAVLSQGAAPQPFEARGRRAGRGVVIAICCLLVLGPATIYLQTARHGFVNCDDDEYVEKNIHIQGGLTPASIWWAITQPHSANWHPLTWMSHMIDWQLFGVWDADLHHYVNSWPGGHHLVNLLLHSANAVLLFLLLQMMTSATWPSAAVAALFAIHPLRVESVAWATERKDLLSGLLFLLTLAAYYAYARRPFSSLRYGLVIVVFILGLMAKSMLVTMPFVLLLLDFWPLRRIAPPPGVAVAGNRFSRIVPPRVILEKLPMLAFSAVSCWLTMWAQSVVAAFKPLDIQYRVGNAVVSYVAYIGQMFYPAGMVVQYVHPGPNLRLSDTLLPLTTLIVNTAAVAWFGCRRRYLAVGWLWYLGMLVPVIGLVQVGAQARADRYTYLTQIGLYFMIAWGLADLLRAWRSGRGWCAAAAAPIIAALAVVAWLQTSYWQNSLALWEHCVACQPMNDFAQNEYGQALADAGRFDEAQEHYLRSAEINPKYLTPRINYAVNLQKKGKSAEVLKVCEGALAVDPNDAQAHFLKAVALYSLNQPDESIREFRIAIQLDPRHQNAHNDLAEVLRMTGHIDEAETECLSALELNPEMPEAHRTLGAIRQAKNDLDGATDEFRTVLKLKPNDPLAEQWLADVLWRQGKFAEAVAHRKQQLALQPQNLGLAVKTAREMIRDPRPEAHFAADALEIARRVCEATGYNDIIALETLASAYSETGDFDQAEATIRTAMKTPEGRDPKNAGVLQRELEVYHAHRKYTIPQPSP